MEVIARQDLSATLANSAARSVAPRAASSIAREDTAKHRAEPGQAIARLTELGYVLEVRHTITTATMRPGHHHRDHAADTVEVDSLGVPLAPVTVLQVLRGSAEWAEDRRKFYVSFTRARESVEVLYSGWYQTSWGRQRKGPSAFLRESGLVG